MDSPGAGAPPLDVDGTLRWNDHEGGFWSLELAAEHPDLGRDVVLSDYEPPAGARDGARARMRVLASPDAVDFAMSGVRVDVLEAELLEG